jgi:hypothetical protein
VATWLTTRLVEGESQLPCQQVQLTTDHSLAQLADCRFEILAKKLLAIVFWG